MKNLYVITWSYHVDLMHPYHLSQPQVYIYKVLKFDWKNDFNMCILKNKIIIMRKKFLHILHANNTLVDACNVKFNTSCPYLIVQTFKTCYSNIIKNKYHFGMCAFI